MPYRKKKHPKLTNFHYRLRTYFSFVITTAVNVNREIHDEVFAVNSGEFYSAVVCFTNKQVAQLSQRDRAAGCVIFGEKWKTETGRQYFTDITGLSSTTVT